MELMKKTEVLKAITETMNEIKDDFKIFDLKIDGIKKEIVINARNDKSKICLEKSI